MPDLLRLLDGDQCQPVAEQLLHLVAEKSREVSERIVQLTELGRSLDRVVIGLHSPSSGACGDDCACLTDTPREASIMLPEVIGAGCTLDRTAAEERLREWSAVAQGATSRENIEGGLRLGLADDTDLGDVARLAAAESICCSMFEFRITVDGRGLAIEVRVPDGDPETVRQLLGARL